MVWVGLWGHGAMRGVAGVGLGGRRRVPVQHGGHREPRGGARGVALGNRVVVWVVVVVVAASRLSSLASKFTPAAPFFLSGMAPSGSVGAKVSILVLIG